MFPNPASSDVNLEVELEQSMNVGIRIYDAVGRLVHEQEGVQSGNTSYKIAIDNLSPGTVYSSGENRSDRNEQAIDQEVKVLILKYESLAG